MRSSYLLIVSLFLIVACGRQHVAKPLVRHNYAPMVVDYPAGVIVPFHNKMHLHSDRNVSLAERILLPHRIPVLDTSANEMVFVKLNGDRVSIAMDKLVGRYDIILFNAVNNPIPLRMADLEGAVAQIFNFEEAVLKTKQPDEDSTFWSSNNSDTTFRGTIRNWLQSMKHCDKKLVISISDSSTRKIVLRPFPRIEWVEQRFDTRTILNIRFENDIITYANTDRYFTNGITIDLQAAWLRHSVLKRLMLPYGHKAFVSYDLSMVQDMYTPTDTRVAPKLSHDRPYASYLYFGFRKTTSDALRKLRISTRLDAGYLGPYSPGSYLQSVVHKTLPGNDPPSGWNTQINTDIILNYHVQIDKAVLTKQNTTLLAGFDAKAGSLYDNIGADLHFRTGKSEPIFGLAEHPSWPKVEYYFFAQGRVSYVAYNALLEGGMFNRNNVFTLKSNDIERIVGAVEAGIHLRYKGTGIELAQHYLSPEYMGGLWHKWGRINVSFKL